MNVRINEQDVDVFIITPDGSGSDEQLTPAEFDVVSRADLLLRSERRFLRENPGARLTRVDSHRGVPDSEKGRFYLRYDVLGGVPTEFWAHAGHAEMVDLLRGVVMVLVGDRASPVG